MESLVSIIIPLYNRAHLITETLKSIQSQSFKDWECIIVDDHSTDNSFKVVQDFILHDKRFSIHKRPNDREKGANACRNYGYEISKGTFINWFDSDDIMEPGFLLEKNKAFHDDNLDGVISKTAMFTNDSSKITGKETRTTLTENCLEDFLSLKIAWYLPDVMWKRHFLNNKPLFDERLLAGQDRDFHARMLLYDPKFRVIDKYLTLYREHGENITSNIDNAKNVKLKMSHMYSVVRLMTDIQEADRLTKSIRVNMFESMIKYLPFTLHNKSDFNILRSLLKQLSFPNLKISKGWFKFYASLFSFRIFGKGSSILR